jgi:hypothetical protein
MRSFNFYGQWPMGHGHICPINKPAHLCARRTSIRRAQLPPVPDQLADWRNVNE